MNRAANGRTQSLGLKGRLLLAFSFLLLGATLGRAAEPSSADSEALAKKLANPVAALISVPIEFDYDRGLGPKEDGTRYMVTGKPVIPITLNENWNLITRTIVPYVSLNDLAPGVDDTSGLADVQESLFFSPANLVGGFILGAGPIVLLPTATDKLLGSEKWGAGPTGIVLRQQGPWTYGALANHVWSFAGNGQRDDVNQTFLQPFVSLTLKTATTFSVNTEATYNWTTEKWSVPLNASVAQVLKVGPQLIQLKLGARYWADAPDEAGPEGWGVKAGIVFLFPKG
jgi:hypothetical protein